MHGRFDAGIVDFFRELLGDRGLHVEFKRAPLVVRFPVDAESRDFPHGLAAARLPGGDVHVAHGRQIHVRLDDPVATHQAPRTCCALRFNVA